MPEPEEFPRQLCESKACNKMFPWNPATEPRCPYCDREFQRPETLGDFLKRHKPTNNPDILRALRIAAGEDDDDA